MIVELSVEEELEEQQAGRGALRCINCGAMVNMRILKNLAAQRTEREGSEEHQTPRHRYGDTVDPVQADVSP